MARDQDLKQLDRLAVLLDSSITVPGTGWKIGFDGILGLIPGIGDLAAGSISTYVLYKAYRLGVPFSVILRMALNVILESVIGVIPIIGDIFDFAFKANMRNVNLMRQYVLNPAQTKTRSNAVLLVTIGGFLIILILLVWGMFRLLAALF